MSKHRRDYTKPEPTPIENETPVEETVPVEESTAIAFNSIEYGTVVNCSRLNVRKNPSKHAPVVRVINAGDTVEIDHAESTNEFYKIEDGYCMRQYIRTI